MELVIFTATSSEVTASTCQCMEKLRQEAPGLGIDYVWDFLIGDSLAPRFYSVMAYKFLKKYQAPYLLFLDSDIVFKPKDVLMILESLRSGYHVVGGLYAVSDGEHFASYIADQYVITGGLVESLYLANGFKGLSRSILEHMVEKLNLPLLMEGNWSECYPFFECGASNSLFISEDWDFCEKVRATSEKVYTHTGVQLGHIKQHIVWAQDTIKRKGTPLNAVPSAICSELFEFLGDDASVDYPDAVVALADRWDSWNGSVEDFYKDHEVGKLYLTALTGFNSLPDYWKHRVGNTTSISNQNIFEIGCGIGSVLFELWSHNKKLVGYDISQAAIDFANWRCEKRCAKNVTFTTEMPASLSEFDLILAIDTLEHIENLQEFLKDLSVRLRPGAKLYHADQFSDDGGVSPMHFDHSQHIDQWLEEAGFTIFDERWCIKKGVSENAAT